MTTEDIERIVKLIASTSDPDVQRILKAYLARSLAEPLVSLQNTGELPGSIKFL